MAAGAGVFLSDGLRERVTTLATAQNVTTDAMLNSLVEREELCRKLSLQTENGDAVPEQQIAGIVSRNFSALSECMVRNLNRSLLRVLTINAVIGNAMMASWYETHGDKMYFPVCF